MMSFLKLAIRAMRRSRHIRLATALHRGGQPARALITAASFHRDDGQLLEIMRRYRAEYAALGQAVATLEHAGAGESVQGHYMPVSAMFFSDTLELCLSFSRGEIESQEAVHLLRDYLANGRIAVSRASATRTHPRSPGHEAG